MSYAIDYFADSIQRLKSAVTKRKGRGFKAGMNTLAECYFTLLFHHKCDQLFNKLRGYRNSTVA